MPGLSEVDEHVPRFWPLGLLGQLSPESGMPSPSLSTIVVVVDMVLDVVVGTMEVVVVVGCTVVVVVVTTEVVVVVGCTVVVVVVTTEVVVVVGCTVVVVMQPSVLAVALLE